VRWPPHSKWSNPYVISYDKTNKIYTSKINGETIVYKNENDARKHVLNSIIFILNDLYELTGKNLGYSY
jgi:hypothetical protein